MRFRFLVLACLVALLIAPRALAQTTGSITGVVKDTNGAPLPGVLVTISGVQMPIGRTATSRSDGVFQFLSLIPGTYQLKAELQGLRTFTQDVVVALNKETQVWPVMSAATTESVEVSATALPLVDVKASEISQVTVRDTMEKLPLNRTFSGTFQLAPGVVDSAVAISNTNVGVNAGGGRQDNTFLYDGVNVTNPFFGDLYQDFAELDIQEVNITRAGVLPEYGRTGGFLINGVTKSGTNNWHGDVRIEYQPASWEADSKDPNLQTKTERFRPGVGVGGPLWQNHLFAYGSLNYYRAEETDRVNGTGSLPNSVLTTKEYFIKLTATPSSSQLIDGSFRYRDIDQTNADINTDAASTADTPKEIDRVALFSWFWAASPTWNAEFRFNHNDYPSGASPVLNLGYQPPFNAADPASVGYWCPGGEICYGGNPLGINNDNFLRNEYRLTATYLGQFLGASHQIKLGGYFSDNEEDLARIANGWGTITIRNSNSNCAGQSPCYRARYSPAQPAQVSRAHTYGIFLQDQATWNRLTLNLGVLVNKDVFIPNDNGQFTYVQGDFTVPNDELLPCTDPSHNPAACTYRDVYNFPFSKQWQPRVGLAYEVSAKAHDKAFVNYARYSNMDNQSFARAAAPIRLYRKDAFFNLTTGAFIQEITRSNNTGKIVLPNIDPTYTDEFAFGYARPFGGDWSFDVSAMWRETKDIIEDFPATGVLDDPGNFRYGNIPAWRKYQGITLQVRKAYSKNWTMDVSYTLSKLQGNWDLDYATQLFYSSSYIEDGPGLYVTDPNRTGTLIGSRQHVGKVFASYRFLTNTNVGGYLRVQSGRPWEAREFDPIYGTDYQYAEKAGSRKTPTWTNFDFLVSQDINFSGSTFRIEARIMNLFNSQPALTVNQDLWLSDNNTDPNPDFGTATSYAQPRRFVISGIFTF